MTPLFSPNSDLVGWLNDDRFIYDLNINVVGFVEDDHAFSYPHCIWLGSVLGTTLQDRNGKPVAFNPDQAPEGQLKPLKPFTPFKPFEPFKPFRPFEPFKPFKPFTPMGGWSNLSFGQWFNQR